MYICILAQTERETSISVYTQEDRKASHIYTSSHMLALTERENSLSLCIYTGRQEGFPHIY